LPAESLHQAQAQGPANKEIEQDFNTFEFSSLVVEPHIARRAGFLFYDVSDIDHPLQGTRLLLRKLRDADGNELFYFEIPSTSTQVEVQQIRTERPCGAHYGPLRALFVVSSSSR